MTLQLLARSRVFRVFAAPIQTIALRQGNLRVDLLHGIVHRAGQIASLHRELHPDVARIVLAVDERGAVGHLDVREFLERNLLSAGRGHQDIADLLRIVPVLAFEAHDEIELLFFLHHLGGHVPADGGLNQGIDVGDVQTVTGDPGAVDLDGQTRLPELLHQGHVADAAHPLQDLLDGLALLLKRVQVGTEDLDRQGAFQAGFRLVHRILRRLRVVENDSGKCLELLVDGLDQPGLGAIRAGPLRVGFETDVKLDVEKAGRIGAVVGSAQLRGDRGDFGKGVQYVAHPGRDLRRFVERNGVGHRCAHPQRAFIQMRHELGADARNEQQRTCQQNDRGERRPPGTGETEIEALGVNRLDGFESRRCVAPARRGA